MCVLMCSKHIHVKVPDRTSLETLSRAVDRYDLTRSSHCSKGSRQLVHIHRSRVESATQQSSPPAHAPSKSSANATYTDGSSITESRPALTSSTVWIGPSCCAAQLSNPLDEGDTASHVLELERPVLPRHSVGVKARQVPERSRLDQGLVSPTPGGPRSHLI